MEILIGLSVMTFGGLALFLWADAEWKRPESLAFAGFMGGFGGAICLCIALLFLALHPMFVRAGIQQLEATRETYEAARAAGLALENAAIQTDVADVNRWLADQLYWNGTVFDIWIPDEVENVQPIR